MPTRRILEMYGNGFYTKHVCRFPNNSTDEGYVNKTLANSGDNYEMVQAIDPNHSGDYENGANIRGSVRINELLAEIRHGNTSSNRYIRINNNEGIIRHGNNQVLVNASGVSINPINTINADGNTITSTELSRLSGINANIQQQINNIRPSEIMSITTVGYEIGNNVWRSASVNITLTTQRNVIVLFSGLFRNASTAPARGFARVEIGANIGGTIGAYIPQYGTVPYFTDTYANASCMHAMQLNAGTHTIVINAHATVSRVHLAGTLIILAV